ncbi:MAG: FMN-binding negative transcriptional regulator [Pseudomonadota bacterium]
MHPNPVFHTETAQRNLDYARDRAFGVLAVATDGGPLLAHVPFLLSDDGAIAELHLVRSNPIVRALKTPRAAKIAVSGPDGYISPDWYGVSDQVPTWNYIAVHLTGTLHLRPHAEMRDMLDRQSAHFENQLVPKPPWKTDKMTPEVLARMMRQIVPCRFEVAEVDGTWKLNQNKEDAVRLAAANHVEAFGIGTELVLLSTLMRGAGQGD